MFDVGGGEILLIVLAILLLFGPRKIPEIASMVGNGMRKVRRAQDEFTTHLRDISTQLETAEEVDKLQKDSNTQMQTPGQPTPDIAPDYSMDMNLAETPNGIDESGFSPEHAAPDAPSEDSPVVVIQPAQGSVSRSR